MTPIPNSPAQRTGATMMNATIPSLPQDRPRRGLSSLEVLVALSLLGSVLALATPLVVAHGRLLKTQRNYRLALDELSNQHERLSALPAADLPAALAKLAPSTLAGERLPGATLRGKLVDAEFGQRISLEIWWDEPNRQAAPVRMTGWIVRRPPAEGNTQE
jgi:hypothetical protein